MTEKVDWKPILKVIPRMLETGALGLLTVPHWPLLSGSLYPPLLEIAGEARTPINLLPVVASFYYLVRNIDRSIDENDTSPSPSQIEMATKDDLTFFLSTVAKTFNNDMQNKTEKIFHSYKNQVYDELAQKEKWGGCPTYKQAYDYRYLLNRVVTDLTSFMWCERTGVKGKQRLKVMQTARHTAMVLQFSDDSRDWKTESPDSGNMVRAIMTEEKEKEPDQKTHERVNDGIKKELAGIQNQSPRVYELFGSISKIKWLFPV